MVQDNSPHTTVSNPDSRSIDLIISRPDIQCRGYAMPGTYSTLRSYMKKIFTIIFFALSNLSFGQTTILIEGRILNTNLGALPGVHIFDNDKSVGQTDFEGYYKIEIDSSTTTLTYRELSYVPTPVLIQSGCNQIEVIMQYAGGCYFGYSQQGVRRINKRSFKSLKKYHRAAFKQGLFKTDKICGEIQVHKP